MEGEGVEREMKRESEEEGGGVPFLSSCHDDFRSLPSRKAGARLFRDVHFLTRLSSFPIFAEASSAARPLRRAPLWPRPDPKNARWGFAREEREPPRDERDGLLESVQEIGISGLCLMDWINPFSDHGFTALSPQISRSTTTCGASMEMKRCVQKGHASAPGDCVLFYERNHVERGCLGAMV